MFWIYYDNDNKKSLWFIDEECNFFIVEIDESVFLMHCVTSEIVTHEYVPVWVEFLVEELLQVLANLHYIFITAKPSLSTANFF